MLPSTGYFKTISCPFFDMGFCERPFCHFKHRKVEQNLQSTNNITATPSVSKLKNEYVEDAGSVKVVPVTRM